MDNSDDKWAAYYEYGKGRPVRPLFTEAMSRAGSPGVAIDLGCGDGTETLALLEAGWTVHAVDASPDGIARTAYRGRAHGDRLTTHLTRLEDFQPPATDLLYSGWTLPFCAPQHFDALWSRLRGALRPGALLVVNLFGPRDDWASEPGMTFRTLEHAQAMAAGLTDLTVTETETDGQSFSGPKHWHELVIIGRVGTQPNTLGPSERGASEPVRGPAPSGLTSVASSASKPRREDGDLGAPNMRA